VIARRMCGFYARVHARAGTRRTHLRRAYRPLRTLFSD
jgi:hypothetical protein